MSFISNLPNSVYQNALETEGNRAEQEMLQAWNDWKVSKGNVRSCFKSMQNLSNAVATIMKNNLDGVCSNAEWAILPRKIIEVTEFRLRLDQYKSDVAKFDAAYKKALENWNSLKAQLELNSRMTTIFIPVQVPAHLLMVNNNITAPIQNQNMNVNSIISVAQPVVNNSVNAHTILSNPNENNSSVAHSQNPHGIIIPIPKRAHSSNHNNAAVTGIEDRYRPKRQKNTR